MNEVANDLVGRTAVEIAGLVRTRQVSPVEVVRAYLERIEQLDARIYAFQLVRAEKAVAEAEALASADDLADRPLAGVPVAIKDNLPVSGEPLRRGTRATTDAAGAMDHETVRRLKAAGAIVVGKTTLPEMGLWATTDSAFGVTRNPWDPSRTAGGSSGGSAAAVAAAMAPIALGNDGLGSIRIPAACCGVLGLKPGAGLVPSAIGVSSWYGLSENGPLATTLDDAALILSVLANRPKLRSPSYPNRSLRVALSIASPAIGAPVDPAFQETARATGALLEGAGHQIEEDNPPYPVWLGNTVIAWWTAALSEEVETLEPDARLEPRTRAYARLGRLVRRLGLRRESDRQEWRLSAGAWFANYDVLVTPALAQLPPDAGPWRERSWLTNLIANTRYAPLAAPWNLAGYPALSIPSGQHPSGLPLGVQLVGKPGAESLLLAVAAQIEAARPWRRHAPVEGF